MTDHEKYLEARVQVIRLEADNAMLKGQLRAQETVINDLKSYINTLLDASQNSYSRC